MPGASNHALSLKVQFAAAAFMLAGFFAAPPDIRVGILYFLLLVGVMAGIAYEVAIGRRRLRKSELVDLAGFVATRTIVHFAIVVIAVIGLMMIQK